MGAFDWRLLCVRHLMTTRIKTLRENASIGRAQLEMKDARIRHFPVVNAEGQLLGLVSDRDLYRAIGRGPVGKSRPVSEIMTTRMQTIQADSPAFAAAKLMRQLKVGMLPVVGAGDTLVGVITETDFLEVAETALRRERVRPKKR
jgi:CBS domain-containing protein